MPSGFQITSYGHCYQALVTAQLVQRKNIRPDDLDTCFNYLRNLSLDIYLKTKDGTKYAKKTYQEFREYYKSEFIIAESLLNKLENFDYPILSISDDVVCFEHSYIYYFFLGMQLASDENDVLVSELCEKVHLRENAFILIFTIHHTNSQNLLDTIRLHCAYSFENIEPAKLSPEETKFMNELIAELPHSIISEKSVSENRLQRRKNKGLDENKDSSDKSNNDQLDEEKKSENDVSIVELNRGMRIMDVLGQILKNRAGSFKRTEVEEILEDTVELGLRILNIFLSDFNTPDFVEWVSKKLDEEVRDYEETKNRELDNNQKIKFVQKMIQFFGYIVTIGMLNRIFSAIASEKLVSSMQSLSENKSTPAYDLINYLISTSQNGIDVDDVKTLLAKFNKTKNYWAKRALSYYVQDYLNTHNLYYKDRQKLSKALSLKYLPNK